MGKQNWLKSFQDHPSNVKVIRNDPPVVVFEDGDCWTAEQMGVFAKCWVAIAEMDYDLSRWREELNHASTSANSDRG